jgi:HAD superfamily hydrolase (TIGR01509 family)
MSRQDGPPVTPRALVFDFDGLILDTEAAEYTSIAAVFSEHGATLGRTRWTEAIGQANPDGMWLDWLEVDLGRPVNRELLWIEQRQRNDMQVRRLQVKPGVIELLEAASVAGLPCAVASSSSSRWVKPHLDRLGLLDHFATVVAREDAPNAKPAPDLYLVALDRLGVPADLAPHAVAFEDSRNGSLAAVAAGLTCVVCTHDLTHHMDLSHAHHRVTSLAELTLTHLTSMIAQHA